jgi:hypothetical protein
MPAAPFLTVLVGSVVVNSSEMSSADEIRDYSQSLARSRTNGGIVQVVLRKAVANEILSGCFEEMGCFLLECSLFTEAPT